MAVTLTSEHIESVINTLPIQSRIMLRLLLLQYVDVSQEDAEYMAADRPDPRFQAGVKPTLQVVARETVEAIKDRAAQYRGQIRQKRERTWLQIECLRKQIAFGELLCAQAERLLGSRFGVDAETIKTLKAQARTAIPKPAIRELDRQWDKDEIMEDDYRRKRLSVEYQTELRKLDRERKRLDAAIREHNIISGAPLQDHEIAHIWGIPSGTLAARKVKALHQYLQGLQTVLTQSEASPEPTGSHPVDLWKETFATLAHRLVERSTAVYDGLERTEAALLERLTALAGKTMPEELESRLWAAITQSLFALQRLSIIQAERDASPESLEQEWLRRASPIPKETPTAPELETKPQDVQLGEMGEHVLRSLLGEDRH